METFTITLKHYATKKWSERYDSDDKYAPIASLYVRKTAFDDGQQRPDTIKVTVEQAE